MLSRQLKKHNKIMLKWVKIIATHKKKTFKIIKFKIKKS
jgi:hypothetical protein